MDTTRQKAMKYIMVYLKAIRHNETFHGLSLAGYVKERLGKKDMYPDTVLRYLRTLKERGEVDYQTVSRRKSEYIKS